MNKIEKLMEELCPKGVEFKKLGEICEISRGVRVIKSQLEEKGKYPVYQNCMTPLGYFDKKNCNADTTFVICGGAAGQVGYSDVDFWAADDCLYFNCIEQLHSKFLYHSLLCKQEYLKSQVRKASVPRLSRSVLEKIEIPLPPLAIQQEIVYILDKFTELEAELEAELKAELEARRKQYEYYRNALLTFTPPPLTYCNTISYKTMGEICMKIENIKWKENYNTEFQYIDLSSVNRENSKITETQIINSENAPSRAQQIVKYEDVIFGTTRPTLKRFCFITLEYDGQICSTGFCILRANKEFILPKYLYFILTTTDFYNYVENNQEGAGYPAIPNSKVMKYKVAVPPLAEQARIVAILDKFDKLVNDISEGLPAEIKMRRQQYEYYRNKLLTFNKAA